MTNLEVNALFTKQKLPLINFLALSLKETGFKGSLLSHSLASNTCPLTCSLWTSVVIFKAHSLEYVQSHPKACMWELNNFLRWCPPNQNLERKSWYFPRHTFLSKNIEMNEQKPQVHYILIPFLFILRNMIIRNLRWLFICRLPFSPNTQTQTQTDTEHLGAKRKEKKKAEVNVTPLPSFWGRGCRVLGCSPRRNYRAKSSHRRAA